MRIQYIKNHSLPDNPGVYIFRDYAKRPLYIGRATSIRDRVRSYFSDDLIKTRGPRLVDMLTKSKSLSFQNTDSVLEAIILESSLIKKYQPPYNIDERDDKSSQYIIITDEQWPRVFLARVRDFDQKNNKGILEYKVFKRYGPFPNTGLIKEALKILRRMFPFRDFKASDARHEMFYRALGLSPSDKSVRSLKEYMITIKYLCLFFDGKKHQVKTDLKKQMLMLASELKFEKANRLKHLLYALDHINDVALIKDDHSIDAANNGSFRIEAYDLSHLSGKNLVGSMTVSINGKLDPSEYRKFKLSQDMNNDVAGLVEILSRRLNHTEWAYPDLIVVDGGIGQINAAKAVLQSRRIRIPIVGVIKNKNHKVDRLMGEKKHTDKFYEEIVMINAESHRFALNYQRMKRILSRH